MKKGNKFFAAMQKLGGSMMLPICMLPAAGLLLGLGMALSNAQLIALIPSFAEGIPHLISTLLTSAGNAIFNNLPGIFAVGVAVGLADDGSAGLAALVGYFMMNQTINVVLGITPEMVVEESSKYASILGTNTLQTGVFGGILIGVTAYFMYRRFHTIELPQYLGFFQAKRFVPIVTTLAAIGLGLVLCLVWPIIQGLIFDTMSSVLSSDNPSILAVFLYAFIFKFLGLFGLHHLVYPIYYYQLGTYTSLAGVVVHGDQPIYFQQLADGVPVTAGACMGGSFIIYMIGLLGVAYAIYKTAKPENRKKVGGMMLAVAMTSTITGITEPLEYAFAFVAFPLYLIHSIITGIGYAIVPALDIHVGTSFSGGIIDYILCSVIPNAPKWWMIIPLGMIFAIGYYFIFKTMILKFNFATPGREEEITSDAEIIHIEEDQLPYAIIKALGTASNIISVGACFTRLRVNVRDNNLVDDAAFKAMGTSGVLRIGDGVQIVFGTQSSMLKDKVNKILSSNQSKKKNDKTILIPLSGSLVNLEDVNDEVFSKRMMGQGFAIDPSEGVLISPVDGTVVTVFPTKHAIGLQSNDGREILIHIGLDTVSLNGEGFHSLVKEGDKVKAGQRLMEFDMKFMQDKVPSLITPIIFPNEQDTITVKPKSVKRGDKFEI